MKSAVKNTLKYPTGPSTSGLITRVSVAFCRDQKRLRRGPRRLAANRRDSPRLAALIWIWIWKGRERKGSPLPPLIHPRSLTSGALLLGFSYRDSWATWLTPSLTPPGRILLRENRPSMPANASWRSSSGSTPVHPTESRSGRRISSWSTSRESKSSSPAIASHQRSRRPD